MTEQHSRLAPSSAARWVFCRGSVSMQEGYPALEESEDSMEGTAAHWVGSETLKNYLRDGQPTDTSSMIGAVAPNGVIITEEMVDSAMVYVDSITVGRHVNQLREGLHIEERVAIHRVHTLCWGTPDAWFFDKKTGVLYVWDYKHGRRIVDPFENWQLIAYVLGVIDTLFPDTPEPMIRVEMTIVQPRSFHHEGPVRTWGTYPENLRPYANMLLAAADAAVGDGAETTRGGFRPYVNMLLAEADAAVGDGAETTSGGWCRYCTARHVCRTNQQAAMCGVDIIGGLDVDELPNDALGLEILILERAKKAVESRLEGLKVQALEKIKKGATIPWWSAVEGKGRQKWDKSNKEIFSLGDILGVELRSPQKPITPKQAITAGIEASVVSTYSSTPRTGLRLVENDGTEARRIFSKP